MYFLISFPRLLTSIMELGHIVAFNVFVAAFVKFLSLGASAAVLCNYDKFRRLLSNFEIKCI